MSKCLYDHRSFFRDQLSEMLYYPHLRNFSRFKDTQMQVDIEHVLFWMDAIRNSDDRDRTLESFWKGQIRSKLWLIENLKPFVQGPVTVDIHGGWNGVLASLLFQSRLDISHIRNVDIDPVCKEIAYTINKIEEMQGRFSVCTQDMCSVSSTANIVINTICEHITQQQYRSWLSKISSNSLLVLQSNNYKISEHIRIANSLDNFIEQSEVNVRWAGELELPLYNRFMIIASPT